MILVCLLAVFVSSLGKCCLGLLPIFQLFSVVVVIELYELLYILKIKLLCVTPFGNIFSQSIGYLFLFCLWFPLLFKRL